MGFPYWSRSRVELDMERRGWLGPIGPLYGMSDGVEAMSLTSVLGDLSDRLRAVSGSLSSLLWTSFFSKAANSGSLLSPGPLAPLSMGTVGSSVVAVGTTGRVSCACLL